MSSNTAAIPAPRTRDYSFDNIKALLIFFVVLGHVLVSAKNHELVTIVYKCIYLFHMPLFVFISGYFSKKAAKGFGYSVYSALVPYVIFAIIFKIVELCFTSVNITTPIAYIFKVPFSYWYLLSLFYWRLITPILAKLKGFALPLTIVIGLLAGFIDSGVGMSLARACAFLPFYWLGFVFNTDTVAGIRKCPKWVCLLGLAGIFTGAVFFIKNVRINIPAVLQMSSSYADSGLTALGGIGVRLAVYVIAALICVCAVNIMPNRKCVLSSVGQATMSIYIAHGYIVLYALRYAGLLDGVFASVNSVTALCICIVIALAITALFSLPIFVKFFSMLTDWLSNLLKKLFDKPAKA